MAKEFKNIKMTVTDSGKIQITIDPTDWIEGKELSISSTGMTYQVASTFGSTKLDGVLSGLKLDLKVMAGKEDYDKRRQIIQQQELAQQAQAEFAKNKEAQSALANLGIDPVLLAQAIGIAQTLQAQQLAQQGK